MQAMDPQRLTYAGIMIMAVATGLGLSFVFRSRTPLTRMQRLGIGLGALCGAMLGAKLPFLFADLSGLMSGAAWLSDGKTLMLGLVGGYLGVEVAKWTLDVRISTGDSFVVPVAASIAIGRLGCFFAGCCYGTPTDAPWGVVFANVDLLARHPTQLYEAIFHTTAAIVMATLWRQQRFAGQLIKLYLIAYLAYRFVTEFIRPEARLLGGLTGYQWAVFPLIGLFAWLWWRDANRAAATDETTLARPSTV